MIKQLDRSVTIELDKLAELKLFYHTYGFRDYEGALFSIMTGFLSDDDWDAFNDYYEYLKKSKNKKKKQADDTRKAPIH